MHGLPRNSIIVPLLLYNPSLDYEFHSFGPCSQMDNCMNMYRDRTDYMCPHSHMDSVHKLCLKSAQREMYPVSVKENGLRNSHR